MKTIFRNSALALLGGLGLSLGLGLAGCKDALDIQPQQGIDLSTGFNTAQKVGAAVVGCYAQLDNSNLYGTDLILVPELIASDGYIDWVGSFPNYFQLASHIQNAQLTNASGIWQAAYANINQTNLVLANLAVVSDSSQRRQYRGEMHFIRAAMYFELVRLYAQQYQAGGGNTQAGVPINLTPVSTVEQADLKLARSSVETVYQLVIKDLQAAIEELPEQNVTRASKFSAEGLLARVYLQQGDFSNAQLYADDVIGASGAQLAGSVGAVFQNRNTAESLFEVQQNDQNNAGTSNAGLATFFAGYSPTGDQSVQYGRSDVRVDGAFAAQYDPADVRGTDSLTILRTKKLIYLSDGNTKTNQLRTLKWRTYGQDIPLIRLAEMYLIRAEGEVRAGDAASALADVNLIRQRSNAPALAAVTLDDVVQERQLELAFEGFRLYDLKRLNRNVREPDPGNDDPGFSANDPMAILPIPQREINVNGLLTQNPGY